MNPREPILGKQYLACKPATNDLRAKIPAGSTSVKLVRAYYYDAIPHIPSTDQINSDDDAEKFDELFNDVIPPLKEYFDKIRNTDFFDVWLGDLIILADGKKRQKGVDTLIAIDMITKASFNNKQLISNLSFVKDLVTK